MKKTIKKYAKIYRTALKNNNFSDINERVESYRQRLGEMYNSQEFEKYNIYPTMDVSKIYAVIGMCLELKKENLSDEDIIEIINSGFERLRKIINIIAKLINSLPNAYQIAKKWNINDHNNRVKDGSIIYDYFEASDEKVEYRISKCMYIEIFEHYGIRSLCKIFCLTDESAYAKIPKHVEFIRHSDLSNGKCCHDEVICRKNKMKNVEQDYER